MYDNSFWRVSCGIAAECFYRGLIAESCNEHLNELLVKNFGLRSECTVSHTFYNAALISEVD